MKRRFCFAMALCLCLGLFSGCGKTPADPTPTPAPPVEETPTPTPEPMPEPMGKLFSFTRENMPRMDGSTSLVPLSQAAASLLLGESREDVDGLVQFNRTSQSYRNLMNDWCDILIASVPSADVYTELDYNNFEYEMAPIATDALIFVVNEGNPVSSLTTEQIIGIYTGEITNWSEVGGADEPIAAFQRNSGAGSQALMEKLVMGDTPMMTPPTELMAGSMGELMEYVRSYDNSSGAIGYSVYYYANDMRMAEGLKIIAVDGVEPTDENIRTGAYPHLSNYYTVIGADEPADSPARIMFEWLQSAEGQRLVQSEGYVPVKSEEDFDSLATASGFLVATHPEALGTVNTPEARYSRLSAEHIDSLTARDDYGALHPFVGLVNYGDWEGAKPVYGLFDEQSRIVCDPVYSEVSRLAYWVDGMTEYVPVLLLGRSINYGSDEAKMVYSFTSLDGSFVSPEYSTVRACDFGVICGNYYSDPNFVIYDFDGNIIFSGGDIKLGGLKFDSLYEASGGYLLVWLTDGDSSKSYLVDMDGNILCGGWESAEFAGEDRLIAHDAGWETLLCDYAGNVIIDTTDSYINALPGERFAAVSRASGKATVYDRDGNILFYLSSNAIRTAAGYIDGSAFYFFDGSSIPLEGEWKSLSPMSGCPVIYKENADSISLMNVLSGATLTVESDPNRGYPMVEQLMVNYVMGPYSPLEYIVFWDGNMEHGAELISWSLSDRYAPEGAAPGMGVFYTLTDGFSGEEYIAVYDAAFNASLYSSGMELVAQPGEWTSVWNGCIVNTDDNFCTYTDMSGRVLFRYPIMINGD